MSPDVINDVSLDAFETDVLARSHDVPVVVDFWASWCGPCRTLGPILEDAVTARDGDVVLAKVDVDANPTLAQRYGVQGIPAVKAFRDGEVVAEFTGAQPSSAVEAFLDRVVPSELDRLVSEARASLPQDPARALGLAEKALAEDPDHRDAALLVAELVAGDAPERASELVRPYRPDPRAEAVMAKVDVIAGSGDIDALRARVAADPGDADARLALGRALAAAGDHAGAADELLEAIRLGGEAREPAREQLLNLFTVLGDAHEVVRSRRPRLAAALF